GSVTARVRNHPPPCMRCRWLGGRPSAGQQRWVPPATPVAASPARRSPLRRRWLGWMAIGLLALIFGALAAASTHAPPVSAAGNPLYLHGTGTAPGCTASTMDANVGTRATPCAIQSAAGGVTTTWAWTGLPAQTVAAGVWTFTMYWSGGSGATSHS